MTDHRDFADRIRDRITIDRSCTADVRAIIREEQDAEGVARSIRDLCRKLEERNLFPSIEEIADLIRQGRSDG